MLGLDCCERLSSESCLRDSRLHNSHGATATRQLQSIPDLKIDVLCLAGPIRNRIASPKIMAGISGQHAWDELMDPTQFSNVLSVEA